MILIKVVRKYLKEVGGDGHGILDPAYLVRIGFEPEFVRKHTQTYKNNAADPKGMLFDRQGTNVKQLEGVYTLPFIFAVAKELGVDTEPAQGYMGRGFRAQACARLLEDHLTKKKGTKCRTNKRK